MIPRQFNDMRVWHDGCKNLGMVGTVRPTSGKSIMSMSFNSLRSVVSMAAALVVASAALVAALPILPVA